MKIHELLVNESEVVALTDNYDELMAAYERIAPNLGSSARFFAKSSIDAYKKLCRKHPEEQCNRWLADKFLALDTNKREQFADLIAIVDPESVPRDESVMDEEPASRDLCLSGKPDSALGASQLASCKSQGYRSRAGGKSHKVGNERIKVRGKKIKGKKYGGPLPDWS
jgi:hypothetical protein